MITRLRIHNFKTFLNFEMELTRRHLLIGKNNSGKSNLCQALRFLGASASLDYDEAIRIVPGGLDAFCNWGFSSRVAEFECTCELAGQGETIQFEYQLHLKIATGPSVSGPGNAPARTILERLTMSRAGTTELLLQSDGERVIVHPKEEPSKDTGLVETKAPAAASALAKIYESQLGKFSTMFKRFLSSFAYFSLSPPLMRSGWAEPALSESAARALQIYGHNLPFALFQLKNEDEPRYRQVLDLVALLEPQLDSFNFFTTPDNTPIPYIIMKGGKRATWQSLSDGTLCVIGLAIIFSQAEIASEQPNWPAPYLMLEEPENGLFRGLFADLWERFSGIAPRAQFIFTSHSPYFLDLFDRDLDSVTSLTREGALTRSRSLADYKARIDEYRNKYDFSLGEQHFKEVFG